VQSRSGAGLDHSLPKERATIRHPNTWISEETLGKVYHEYRRTYDFPSEILDPAFRALIEDSPRGMLVRKIKGWLRTADALKIYELAYFCAGAILELGTFEGLSSSVIASAIRNSGRQREFTSVDVNSAHSLAASANLMEAGLINYVELVVSEGADYLDHAITTGRQYGFVFIDHSQAYKDVVEVCTRLGKIAMHGAFAVFHDFNDPRNRPCNFAKAGVFQAVQDALDVKQFEFYGTYGCCGLYRRA
jgi:hypothetical protein